MKSSDEIKKGLACCAASIYQCADDCPYRDECRNGQGGKVMNEDALAYIQQLETDIYEANKNLDCWRGKLDTKLDSVEAKIKRLIQHCKQLEAERDALMQDMGKSCASCKHSYLNNPGIDCCPYVEQCQDYAKWEWRGAQKD